MERKKLVGLVEKVRIIGKNGSVEALALLDTGASKSSVDYSIAAQAGLVPVTKVVRVKSKAEKSDFVRRAVVSGKIELAGIVKETEFTITDRSRMSFPVLVGRDVLAENFIIDPSLKRKQHENAQS